MRNKFFFLAWILILSWQTVACSAAATLKPSPTLYVPTQAPLTRDPLFQSSGGGEPRSTGYWLIWNSCVEGNQAAVAQSNGGREAGWIILDDLLINPGILVGTLSLENCQQGINILQARDQDGTDHSNDLAYSLASQLLSAQLNLAVGSEYCPASDQAVSAAQLLLLALGFNGTGSYLDIQVANQDAQTAQILVEQLSNYNTGALCR